MMPGPEDFTGSPRQRRKRCIGVCEDVALLLLREACYTMGAHPHLSENNARWRREVGGWSEGECWQFFRRLASTWPARLVRP